MSAATNVIPSWMALRHRHDLAARLSAAIMIVVQPAAIVAVNRGGEWQMDMHMYFFANLAALTILCDWRPIVFASALIGVHHLLLNWFAPGLVFRCAPNRRWAPPRRPIAEQRWKPRRTPG
jgi:methyl-accepting chemotaxis protein